MLAFLFDFSLISFQKFTLLAWESKLLIELSSISNFSPAYYFSYLSLKLFSILDKFEILSSKTIFLISYFDIFYLSIISIRSSYKLFINLAWAIWSIFKSSWISIPYPSIIAYYSRRFRFLFYFYFLFSSAFYLCFSLSYSVIFGSIFTRSISSILSFF